MSNICLTPKETTEALINSSLNKTSMSIRKKLLLSIMAGVFISLGAQGFMTAYDNTFLRAAIFPIGLMLIVIVGGELFTGDCLMTFGLVHKQIKVKDYLQTMVLVYLGNFIGSLIIVYLIYHGGVYSNQSLINAIIALSKAKISMSFVEALTKGILCNILVTLGVWFATSAKDTSGKILGCWFPILLFVLCGYEHCIANMFFLPMGAIFDSSISWVNILINNLLPVTIGNFIGGGIIIPLIYYKVYY